MDANAFGWKAMDKAPKDGTMLRILVRPDLDSFTPFEDSVHPYETIGFNNLSNTDEDRWQFAGWSWEQDCFTDGFGEPIGWLDISERPAVAGSVDDLADSVFDRVFSDMGRRGMCVSRADTLGKVPNSLRDRAGNAWREIIRSGFREAVRTFGKDTQCK